MKFLSAFVGMRLVALSICIVPFVQVTAKGQESERSTSKVQKMGPVGQEEAKPSKAAPPVSSVVDPGVIPSRQNITPAGLQSVFESRVNGVAFGENGDSIYAAVLGQKGSHVYRIDLKTNRMMNVVSTETGSGMQGLAYDPTSHTPLLSGISGVGKGQGSVGQLVALKDKSSTMIANGLGSHQIGALSIGRSRNSNGQRFAVVALTFDDEAAVIDLDTKEVHGRIKTGIAPFGTVVNADSSVAYVSNWGGRVPKPGERSAATGPEENADQVLVDERGVASSGTVARIDLLTGQVTATVAVGLHPSGLAWDETRKKLYVANSNSDSISIVDTATNRLQETILLQPFNKKVAGISPESVALSPDHSTLYVACAGINAVAVIDLKAQHPHATGFIPTGWYPDDVTVSPDGKFIAVSTLLGVGTGWNSPNLLAREKRDGMKPELNIHRRYVHADRGTVHIIQVPDKDELGRYSIAVAENNHMGLPNELLASNSVQGKPNPGAMPRPVPVRTGEPSTIEHVVYIIKENRSYDQYFGSLGKGNGDPSLNMYGDDVIPNQRKLARDFVLLDNFYANGGNSADGHQWLTQASETDYAYWPGYDGRSYPKNGDDPLAFAGSGFLWDHLAAHHKTFADFGEYVGEMGGKNGALRAKLLGEYKQGSEFIGTFTTKAPIARLNQYLVPDFPSYGLKVPDVTRARIFLRHLKTWENSGTMPNLVMIQMPSDHTEGTTPGFSTPKACLADNDLAVGQIVDGISHSKFWKSTLILIVEDDAQDGLDHVDGHRTVALAVSPYTQRGAIDSTFYSQVSMVKTIELILGVPPMSLFDLIANDMRQSFQSTPDLTPYQAIEPVQSIYELNPEVGALNGQSKADAIASGKMNWVEPDDVPTEQLNQILWRNAMDSQYPSWKRGSTIFQPGSME
ncbi:bifunctional YncE family protein/alkaline phosphatase family protein [Granulicella mallensis]|uniref:40-residue YVTN family beta-propeller repeat protein n=1 Tax=Granulicella mallensis (strain ATCC BAA-1857 / DSM 23137 / MP5ACTX8) TaxID=682795 RepID=G8NYB1_GRAMM|nr:bifunctional YncE family protein/alkaline phosphatase family protein [Granulicella mallensis]AEU37877.1 40-residue YVTN family beta-propeller repeat protein [Granulicella mallensis MP5ACTX8]